MTMKEWLTFLGAVCIGAVLMFFVMLGIGIYLNI